MRRGQELEEIDNALALPGRSIRFIPRLEAAYEAARGGARNRAISRYLLIYLAAKLLLLFCNLRIGTHVFAMALLLRIFIVLPLTLVCVFLLGKPFPSWVYGYAAFTPLIAETALVLLLGRLSGGAFTERYIFAAAIGIFAQTLLMIAPFRQSVIGLAVALTVFCAIGAFPWAGHFGPPVLPEYLIFVIGLSLPALFERRNREYTDRRDFLLGELNRLRMEDILRMNAHLERLSSLDGLTGIFNRRYLDAALHRLCEAATARERWISVLMIDVDHFKSVNDTAGHQYGDLCLEQVAQILQSSVRAGIDTVGRYGGEEFVAILPDADEPEALIIAERIRSIIQHAALRGGQGRVLTVSTGAACIRGEKNTELSPVELIASADEALYQAKKAGRNRIISAGNTLHPVSNP
jgi:diguanylate cyclase (GGDEF)-like protein